MKNSTAELIDPPSFFLTLLELPRMLTELTALIPTHPLLYKLPAGDGHTVMTLPGFLSTDLPMSVMRLYLRRWGYAARPWGLGRNVGLTPNKDIEKLLDERLETLYHESGRKVSLVGWSLGGLYAREMARRHPERVRTVITLGSPMGDPKATRAWRLYEYVSKTSLSDGAIRKRIQALKDPVPGIPQTAIYSKSDSVVSWRIAKIPAGDNVENIGVNTSHFGMGFHPAVIFVLADRLSQPEGRWSPFEINGLRKLFFH